MKRILLILALVCIGSPALAYDDTLSPWGDKLAREAFMPPAAAVQPVRKHRRRGSVPASQFASYLPSDMREPGRLLVVAESYRGSRRFTARARAWCADALGAWLRMAGFSSTGDGRAISYLHYGRPSGPHVGAIAVLRHHVGIVVGQGAHGPILLSGNHGKRVGVGEYSARRILAYREPV